MTSKILVADDSITIQKIVTMAFESEDAEVQGVGNGKEAWARLDAFQPDVVLADVDMPGLSGFDLSRKIKSSAAHQQRRVVLLCSDFEEFDEKEFEVSGADDHLSKPFKSEDIVSMVKRLLSGEVPVKTLPVTTEAPAAEMETPAATLDLSAEDLIEELLDEESTSDPLIELTADDMEPVVELTAEDMDPMIELSAADMEPEEDEPVEEASGGAVLLTDDQMVEFDESLVPETMESAGQTSHAEAIMAEPEEVIDEASPDFYVGERPRRAEAVEDLDEAFRSVAKSRPQPAPEPAPAASPSDASKPDLIRESRAFLKREDTGAATPPASARPEAMPGELAEQLNHAMSDHAIRLLEASLDRNLKKELAGLTDQVRQVVHDVVKEIAPEIIRSVIREEIEQIRKMEEV